MGTQYLGDFTSSEFLAVSAAREINNYETIFAGIGIPLLGALLAQATHAKNAIIAMESGSIGALPHRMTFGIGDNPCIENALIATSLWRLFSDQQKGFFDVGMVGGAQVDRFGNLNSTAIFGTGTYEHPAVRLPGSGGANDIASTARRTIITMPLQRQRFLERVDYITSPGFLNGGDAREQNGLHWGGPAAVITDRCIFRFDPKSKEMYLDSIHPGVSVDDVRAQVSWNLKVSPNLKETELPTKEQIKLLRELDPEKIYTGNGLKTLTFERYIGMLNNYHEQYLVE